MTAIENIEFAAAKQALELLMSSYSSLSETQKFELGKTFNQTTGGKLSPYNSPQPVVVAIIPVYNPATDSLGIVVTRRAIAPKIGELALPGGFMEHHEHAQDAICREIREELGLTLDPTLFELFHTPRTSHNNNALIFFRYTRPLAHSLPEIVASARTAECAFENSEILIADSQTPLAFELHSEAVQRFFSEVGALHPGVTP